MEEKKYKVDKIEQFSNLDASNEKIKSVHY